MCFTGRYDRSNDDISAIICLFDLVTLVFEVSTECAGPDSVAIRIGFYKVYIVFMCGGWAKAQPANSITTVKDNIVSLIDILPLLDKKHLYCLDKIAGG